MASKPAPGPAFGSSPSSGLQFLNSPFGDTTHTKVFVGGLAWETHSDTMRRYFQHFGEILEAVVITDKNTGRSKGYGFVTFREPEAAKRACADSAPIIDNRRANCNLASLGRPRPALPSGRLRPVATFFGCAQTTDGSYVGNFGYQQPIPFYQQGFMYPPYEYQPYGTKYIYPQGVGNHYGSQQYLQVYGVPGPVNTAIYPYAVPGAYGYPPVQGYAMSGHQIAQFGGSSVNAIHFPYPAGVMSPRPASPQLIRPVHSKFVPDGNADKVVV